MTQPLPFPAAPTDTRIPRWYQEEAIAAVEDALVRVDSALLVMATGTGKTASFSWYAKQRRSKRENILCLAHTKELVEQNAKTLEAVLGEPCYIEQGDLKAPPYAQVVSASFQSITQDRRLKKWGRDHWGLKIVDEAHRSLAPTFLKVINYYEGKLLGVTATPDRGDERALGAAYDEVAYVFDIVDGIESGFLKPIEARNVNIQEVDISHVSLSQGDLAAGDLDLAMLQGVEGICQKTLELAGDRCGVLFFPGVQSAEVACDRLNTLRPRSTCFVHGGMEKGDRDKVVADFKAGVYDYLCNCMVAIEGFDAPRVNYIGWARPTKSRWLFAQGVGRGLRPLPGVVDHLPHAHQAELRRMLIRMSESPDCLLLNFVGNAGRHSLVTPEDLLGGDYEEPEVQEAKKRAEAAAQSDEAYDPLAALKDSRKWLQTLTREARSTVKATVTAFDPFMVLDINMGEDRIGSRYGVKPPTEKQIVVLRAAGVDDATLGSLDRRGASKMLDSMRTRREQGLASLKQMRLLGRYGINDNTITFEAATRGIDYIKAKGWGKNGIDQERLNQALGRSVSDE